MYRVSAQCALGVKDREAANLNGFRVEVNAEQVVLKDAPVWIECLDQESPISTGRITKTDGLQLIKPRLPEAKERLSLWCIKGAEVIGAGIFERKRHGTFCQIMSQALDPVLEDHQNHLISTSFRTCVYVAPSSSASSRAK